MLPDTWRTFITVTIGVSAFHSEVNSGARPSTEITSGFSFGEFVPCDVEETITFLP